MRLSKIHCFPQNWMRLNSNCYITCQMKFQISEIAEIVQNVYHMCAPKVVKMADF